MGKKTGLWIVLLLVLVMGSPLACNTTTLRKEAGSSDVTGTYVYVSIDGHSIPCEPMSRAGSGHQEERYSSVVVSGVMTLQGDGTLLAHNTYVLPSGTVTPRDFKGTYAHVGSGLTIDWEVRPSSKYGSGSKVTVDGSTLTVYHGDNVIVYEKIIEDGKILPAFRAWEN